MRNPNLVAAHYKLAAEDYAVSLDFAPWLSTGDTVATHTVTCYAGTTNMTSTMIGTTTDDDVSKVVFRVKGGTAGTQYLITVTATTAQADVFVGLVNLIVN